MKYYIATKLENHAAHNALRDILNKRGHEITYDWTHHGPVYSHGLERVREVAELEINGVLAADVVIVLWPGGRGTHVEMGAALAQNKPVVFVSDIEAHHKATTETCAFYHSASVTRCKDFRDVAPILTEFAARQPAEVQEPVGGLDWISVAIRDMCEIPYRDSPEGMPDMLVVSAEEIRDAIERRMPHPAPLPDTVSVPDAWMPIETAPKVGRILVWNAYFGVYSSEYHEEYDNDDIPIAERKVKWSGYPLGLSNIGFGKWYCVPILWQPLPPPPK